MTKTSCTSASQVGLGSLDEVHVAGVLLQREFDHAHRIELRKGVALKVFTLGLVGYSELGPYW